MIGVCVLLCNGFGFPDFVNTAVFDAQNVCQQPTHLDIIKREDRRSPDASSSTCLKVDESRRIYRFRYATRRRSLIIRVVRASFYLVLRDANAINLK